MKRGAPAFWQQERSLWKTLLTPISCLYRVAYNLNKKQAETYHSSLPVICVGNVTVGGSGKTPVVQSLLNLLKDRSPCVLSRGYGGNKNLHQVTPHDTFEDVGDEPVLLSRFAPVVVAADRGKGAKLIEESGFGLIIMDDGFQNFTLKKDLSFLVVDGIAGFGNRTLLPAGPLRESLDEALTRTNAIILINDDTYGVKKFFPPELPVFEASIEPDFSGDTAQTYIAFCGIGHPEKFKRTLEQLNMQITEFLPYPDHYAFQEKDVQNLIKQAGKTGARLITTEKDAARLSLYPEIFEHLDVLPIKLKWADEKAVQTFLQEALPV